MPSKTASNAVFSTIIDCLNYLVMYLMCGTYSQSPDVLYISVELSHLSSNKQLTI